MNFSTKSIDLLVFWVGSRLKQVRQGLHDFRVIVGSLVIGRGAAVELLTR